MVLAAVLCWVLVIAAIMYTYKKQPDKVMLGKIILAYLAGRFSFSLTFTYFNESLKIAILPLGLWILYFILIRRRSWKKYCRYAWVGFLSNYLFLASMLLVMLLHTAVYAPDSPRTYVADISAATVIITHNTAAQVTLAPGALHTIQQAKAAQMDSGEWHYEVLRAEKGQQRERFPYLLVGTEAKRGSGYKPTIYIEKDRCGLLILTDKQHLYFRTEQPILSGEVIK